MRLVTANEMRVLDRHTIEVLGVPGVVLMESAGRAVADLAWELLAQAGKRRVVVVAGPGNNGGDGYVAARHLHHRGAEVRVLLLADEPKIAGDARTHYEAMRRSGVPVEGALHAPSGAPDPLAVLAGADLVIDALLGTGAARPVTGRFLDAIDRINAAPGLRLAVDVPSGLDCDRGQPQPRCVQAHHTVTFAFAKLGLATAPGYLHAGRLHVADIGIPRGLPDLLAETQPDMLGPAAVLLDDAVLAPLRAPRPPLAHKGTSGHLLVVAGSRQHPGAALLCAQAAMRAGAGLVTLAAPEETERALAARVVEVSTASLGLEAALVADAPDPALDEHEADALVPELHGEAAWTALARLVEGKQAVAFGPGVPRLPGMRRLLERLLAHYAGPVVLDADGLNLLAEDLLPLSTTRAQVILTPHPAELGRLARLTTAEVQADRVGVARAFAERHGVLVVLKGARTVIASPDGRVAINLTGNPGLASGGTGDALTGIVGALLAQGLPTEAAARAGVYLHGRAGDLARDAQGCEQGLLASDLIAHIPRARFASPPLTDCPASPDAP